LTVISGGIPSPPAQVERWIRTLRADCLDRILILGRRHLEHVLHIYRRRYDEHGPHRALRLQPPDGRDPTPLNAADRYAAATSLADSSTNTRPPEVANATRYR